MKGYQLRISVQWSDPEIWRRILIPGKITFRDLHMIIQKLFGWENVHPYEFYMEKTDFNLPGNPAEMETGMTPGGILVDDFLRKEKQIWYLYDLGDSWEHLIEIEKRVEVDCRWPQVLDAVGPDMIEDCGGILEFEQNREQAAPFRMEEVNRWFRKNMDLPRRERKVFLRASALRIHWEEPDDLEEIANFLRGDDAVRFNAEQELREKGAPRELAEVFEQWSRQDLCELARECGFRGYSKLKKKELVVWLQEQLLQEETMFRHMKKSSPGELKIFQSAIENGIVRVPADWTGNCDFLWAYCGYDPRGYLVVPENVRDVYRKTAVPERITELEAMWKIRDFCRGAVYLYGTIPIRELKDLWKHYEGTAPDTVLLKECLRQYRDISGEILYDGSRIMDEWLEDDEDRELLEKKREGLVRYLPETMEEFLRYGREGKQAPDADSEPVLRFFQKKLHSREDALDLFYDIQERVRTFGGLGDVAELIRSLALDIPRGKPEQEWAEYFFRETQMTRNWASNGFTFGEVEEKYPGRDQPAGTAPERQSLAHLFNKKIYPNDPCPCGSGKKYKHCCGRKK